MKMKKKSERWQTVEYTDVWEAYLEETLPGNITPWKKAIGFLIGGLALLTFQLKMKHLEWILPTVGYVLLYLGLRSLRRENKWFRISWWISMLSLVVHTCLLIGMVLPLADSVFFQKAVSESRVWEAAGRLLLLLCFRQGLKVVYEKAEAITGTEAANKKDPVLWVLLWHLLLIVVTFLPWIQGWLLGIGLTAVFFAILYQLDVLGNDLEDTGYFLEPTPIRIGNRMFSLCYLTGLLVVILCCGAWCSHLPLKEVAEPERAGKTMAVKNEQRLCELGFPAELAANLSERELELFQEAVLVEVKTDEILFDPKEVWVKTGDHSYPYSYHEEKRHRLEITMVVIELSQGEVYTALFWQWGQGNPWWQDAFFFEGEKGTELIGGSLLYERKGVTYRAEIPGLSYGIKAGVIGGEQQVITGKVSYPFGSQRQRGYLLCHIGDFKETSESKMIKGIFCYYHDNLPFCFPYQDTQRELLQQHYAGDKYQKISFLSCELGV